MDNDQRQSWWPDEYTSDSHPAPKQESTLPKEHCTEQNQEQPTSEEHSAEQNQEQPFSQEYSSEKNQEQQSRQDFQNWYQNQQPPNSSQNWYQNQQSPNNTQNWYQNPNSSPSQLNRLSAGNGMVIASMIMGIISVLLICCGLSYFFGALGIIFALLSRRDGPMESQAKVGLSLSIVGAVGGIILLAVTIVTNFSTYQELYQELEEYYLDDDIYYEYDDFLNNYDNYLDDFNSNDILIFTV